MWGKIIIPMYRLWLHGLYGPRCPLSPKRPINLISLLVCRRIYASLSLNELIQTMDNCFPTNMTYQHRNFHCGSKMIITRFCFHNGHSSLNIIHVQADHMYLNLSWPILTHWGRDKMAAIFHTTFSNVFSWMKMYELRTKFHWSLFQRFQLTIFQHWFKQWLVAWMAPSHSLNQSW